MSKRRQTREKNIVEFKSNPEKIKLYSGLSVGLPEDPVAPDEIPTPEDILTEPEPVAGESQMKEVLQLRIECAELKKKLEAQDTDKDSKIAEQANTIEKLRAKAYNATYRANENSEKYKKAVEELNKLKAEQSANCSAPDVGLIEQLRSEVEVLNEKVNALQSENIYLKTLLQSKQIAEKETQTPQPKPAEQPVCQKTPQQKAVVQTPSKIPALPPQAQKPIPVQRRRVGYPYAPQNNGYGQW